MKRPRKRLPEDRPCPVCDRAPDAVTRTPAEVRSDVHAHNLRAAEYGERSYAPFRRAAVIGFLLGVAAVSGCGRTLTEPECRSVRVDTLRTTEGLVAGTARWCL